MHGRCEISKRRSLRNKCALQIPNIVSKLIVNIHVSCISNRRNHSLNLGCMHADRQAFVRTSEGQWTSYEAASKRDELP